MFFTTPAQISDEPEDSLRKHYQLPQKHLVDTLAPKFISPNKVEVSENQTLAIVLKADDVNDVTYSIYGGDADSFTIDKNSGSVEFKEAPIYGEKIVYYFQPIAHR